MNLRDRRELRGIVIAAGFFAMWTIAGGAQSSTSSSQSNRPLTFAEDVAPILYANCVSCHRPGEAAPFSLMTYEDVRPRGRQIANVTRSRQMPPWKAAGDYAFHGERRLADAQIDVLQRWADGGMLEGDAKKLPKKPVFPNEWPLGKPDLIVSMPEAFTVPAGGRDVYRNFVLPLNLKEDKWVRAVDFRPSARPVVHHVILFTDTSGDGRQQDAADPGPGFGGVMGQVNGGRGTLADLLTNLSAPASARGATARGRARGQNNSQGEQRDSGGTIGGWVPGAQSHPMPEGMAFFLPRGADLIPSIHFHPASTSMQEASTIALYFSKTPPTRGFMGISLPPNSGLFNGINIPPGDANYTIRDSFVVPVDVKAIGVGAHAHYLGRDMTLTATLPNGTVKTLLSISDWDLNWQERYEFKEEFIIPAGTRLDSRIHFDNSAANKRNPFSPPQRVTFGPQSTNEMGSITLQITAAGRGTLPQVQDAYAAHVRQLAMASPVMQQFQQNGGRPGPGRGAPARGR